MEKMEKIKFLPKYMMAVAIFEFCGIKKLIDEEIPGAEDYILWTGAGGKEEDKNSIKYFMEGSLEHTSRERKALLINASLVFGKELLFDMKEIVLRIHYQNRIIYFIWRPSSEESFAKKENRREFYLLLERFKRFNFKKVDLN